MIGKLTKPLVLASASPRRQQLLSYLGLPYVCMVSGANEALEGDYLPEEAVELIAERKARAVLPLLDRPSLVVGADTVVVLDEERLGKPQSRADAKRMLQALSGRVHAVYTGLCVLDSETGEFATDAVRTEVCFAPISEAEIDAYIATGEPMDKAGAYAIQGPFAANITGIHGCYYNVVGLPLHALKQLLTPHLQTGSLEVPHEEDRT